MNTVTFLNALNALNAFKEFKLAFIGLVWIFLGVTVTYNSWSEYHIRSQLNNHGKLTQATPLAWNASEDQKTHQLSNFTLKLRYVTERGDMVTVDEIPAPSDIGIEVQQGRINTVRIKYLPENPSAARLALDMSTHVIELSMGLLLLVGGVVVTIAMVRYQNKKTEMRKY